MNSAINSLVARWLRRYIAVLAVAGFLLAMPAAQTQSNGPAAAGLTGAVQGLRPGYFQLVSAGKAPLWVRIIGASIQQNGRVAQAAALHTGVQVQVQGRMVGDVYWATSVTVLPQATQQAQMQSPVQNRAVPFYRAPMVQSPPPTPQSNGPAAAGLTGAVQGLRPGYFQLAAAGKAPLWVRIIGASIQQNGRAAQATALHAGVQVQVQGRMVGDVYWATSVTVLPQATQQAQMQSPVQNRAVPFYRAPMVQSPPPTPQSNGPAAAGLTGAVRGLRPGYFQLAAAGKAPLWVRIIGASIQQNGRAAQATALHAGVQVQIQGRMVGDVYWATSVTVLPQATQQAQMQSPVQNRAVPFYRAPMVQSPPPPSPAPAYGNSKEVRTGVHPVLSPLRLPMLRYAPVNNLNSLAQNQSQIHARVSAVQHVFPALVAHPGSNYSRQPVNRNLYTGTRGQPNPLSYPSVPANPPEVNDLAPIVSMFANGDRYGDLGGGTNVPTQQIMSATFFSDPDPNWSASPGIIGASMPTNPSTVATTQPTAGMTPLTPTFVVPVTSTTVNLVVPCYYLEGYGAEVYDHAHFEVKIEYETTPGTWQPLTTAALEWGNAVGYIAPSGLWDYTINPPNLEDGKGYAWTIPVTLPAVANTLRVDVYMALYQSGQEANPNSRIDPNQAMWTLPGAAGNQVGAPLSNGNIVTGSRHNWLASAPFQVVLLPTQILSADAVPYGIIYMPPGNKSTESLFSIQSTAIGTSFSVGNSNSTQVANVQGTTLSVNAGASFAGVKLGGGVTLGSNSTQTSGMTSSDNQTESLSLTSSWQSGWPLTAPSNPQLPANDALTGQEQPYWNDNIIVIPHPVYAIWNYSSSGPQSFSAAQLMDYDKIGPVPVFVRDLATCAGGSGYSSGTLVLSPADCTALLALDPFYVAGWQGATPPAGRAVLAPTQPGGAIQGGTGYEGSRGWGFASASSSQSTQSSSNATESSLGQGSGSSTTVSGSVGFSVGGIGASVSASSQNSQSTTNTLTTTYTSTQTNTTGSGMQVSGTIADTGTMPSNIQVWIDSVFGGVMFQDPNEQRFAMAAQSGRVAIPNAAQLQSIRNAPHWEVVRH